MSILAVICTPGANAELLEEHMIDAEETIRPASSAAGAVGLAR
jgi:hypothetical protein